MSTKRVLSHATSVRTLETRVMAVAAEPASAQKMLAAMIAMVSVLMVRDSAPSVVKLQRLTGGNYG